jgi:hypothetical protein
VFSVVEVTVVHPSKITADVPVGSIPTEPENLTQLPWWGLLLRTTMGVINVGPPPAVPTGEFNA